MKDEALKLAVWLENKSKLGWADNFGQELDEASAMIRRLVEELSCANDYIKQYQFEIKNHKYDPETGEPLIDGYPLFSGLPRGKPLSDEEIKEIWFALERELGTCIKYGFKFARAIEERHGIK